MRRFSQRTHLVTLNEINITPLLDLAFVLLIIFIITTPLLENGLDLRLPQGGAAQRRIQREDLATAEVNNTGVYYLNGSPVGSYDRFQTALARLKQAKPNLVVNIRAPADGAYKYPFSIMNLCQQMGIGVQLAAEPPSRR